MSHVVKVCLCLVILGVMAQSTVATLNIINVYRKEVFNIAVVKNSKPVVVYYTSSSCTICNIVYNKLENFAKENPKAFYVAKVDFDKNPELKEEFGIEKVPTTRAYIKGEIVQEVKGPIWPLVQGLAKSVINN